MKYSNFVKNVRQNIKTLKLHIYMTISIGQVQEREQGVFSLIDDWLKRDRFVFIG